MIIKWKTVIVGIGVVALMGMGCGELPGDTSEEDKEEGGSGTVAGTGGGGTTAENVRNADSVEDLQLAKAFKLTLPGALAVDSGGSPLHLLQELKSQEACEMGQTIREVTQALDEVGNFFCHIEAEKDKIKFGEKVQITFQGNVFARLWVDNSEEDRIRIGFCSDDQYGSNSQIIDVTGLSDSGPIGTIINKGTFDEQDDEGNQSSGTFHRSVDFDMSEEGIVNIDASDVHSQGDGGDKFNRKVALKLLEDGISEAVLAARGVWQSGEFADRGKALFDGEYGAAIFAAKGTHNEDTFEYTRKGFFTESGDVAAESDTDAYAAGGDLHLTTDDLPEFLAEGFAPSDLDGWVKDGCSDFDVEVELDPDSAEHQSCDGNQDGDNHVDCWDEAQYQMGEEIQ